MMKLEESFTLRVQSFCNEITTALITISSSDLYLCIDE